MTGDAEIALGERVFCQNRKKADFDMSSSCDTFPNLYVQYHYEFGISLHLATILLREKIGTLYDLRWQRDDDRYEYNTIRNN